MFWLREVAGWALVLVGLYFFAMCVEILIGPEYQHMIFEAGPLTLIGIFVFRGGIHLLKVSVAARVCLQAQKTVYQPQQPAPAARGRDNAQPKRPAARREPARP